MVDFQSRDTTRDETTDETEADTVDPGEATEEPPEQEPATGVGFAVVTVGSERTIDEDAAGDAVVEALGDTGEVVTRDLIDDRFDGIQSAVGRLVDREDVDVLLTIGGTGPQPSDVTVEAVEPMLDKHLPGVGELIREHCVEERGTAVIRTRTMGGIIEGVPVVCLPGEPRLARTAMREVVVPEAEPLSQLAAIAPE